jgi:simple sugar transport system permease protein
MNELHSIFDPTLLNSTVRSVSPILLAALGGLLCARVGVFNVALEGMMLVGAFFAVVGSYYSGSAIAGVAAGILAGMALATILAVLAVSLRGNEVVLGIALNLLATGLTAFLIRAMFGVQGLFQSDRIKGIPTISLGPIANMPILGPMVNGQIWIVYFSWVLVVATYVLLFRTPLGLRMRGVGEQPRAAASLGVSVARLQYVALLLSGALCGLAGSQLSLGDVQLFSQNMSAGRGWIAVVAVMLGQANPFGVLGASALFGLADAIGFRLQGLNMPSELTATIPYIATLVALAAVQLRRRRKFEEAT